MATAGDHSSDWDLDLLFPKISRPIVRRMTGLVYWFVVEKISKKFRLRDGWEEREEEEMVTVGRRARALDYLKRRVDEAGDV